jgi:hypothetical protein
VNMENTMDTQLIALDPHQMAQAQNWLIEWCDGKLKLLDGEMIQAHGIIDALRKGSMSDARGRRLVSSINKRVAFYTKIKAALSAGYYILPPIPHQAFAVRTTKVLPPPETRRQDWSGSAEVAGQSLPVGEGEYKNAIAVRAVIDEEERERNGKTELVRVWENTAWREIEFPFFPVKPEIIEATSKALSKKIFDWLGVAPQSRSTDPMVIGCIRHYKQYQQPLHFFVAWWLNVDTL